MLPKNNPKSVISFCFS